MAFEKFSTYVPFSRRFTNERNRELSETRELYAWVKVHQDAFGETQASLGRRVFRLFEDLSPPVVAALTDALFDLLNDETQIWELPAPDFERMSLKEFVEYRNLLHAKQYFFANQAELIGLLEDGLIRTLCGKASELPEMAEPTPFTIPLLHAIPDVRDTIQKIWGTLADYHPRHLFRPVVEQLHRNICIASGRDPEDETSRKPHIFPSDSPLPPNKVVETYLRRTPFEAVFKAPVPLKLTYEDRFNHTHILGGTGAGKTTLLENLILHDLQSDDQPTIVLIDPHGDLIQKLTRADIGIEDRLVLISPRDTQNPVALSIFALNQERLAKYDEATREQVMAGVLDTFKYLFSSLFDLQMTGKQQVLFDNVLHLLLAMPETMGRNATILDMLKLMSGTEGYEAAIAGLSDIPREFFQTDFYTRSYNDTKEQVRYRIQGFITNPTLARLFSSSESRCDFFSELNRGAVVLIDTAKDFLKGNSAIYGRLMVSLILQAVMERAAIPERERKPTFIFVDEAASVFDENIDDALAECRKYKAGLVLAHQYLDQATGGLRASLAANTGIKFASGLSAGDAAAMARDMRCTADFILSQPSLQFAAHIRNVTAQAVSIPIQPVTRQRQLSLEQYDDLIERNRAKVSKPRGPLARTSGETAHQRSPQAPDDDLYVT